MDAASDAHGYGGFMLGEMALALPMAALREVVPRTALIPLPCEAPCVVGAIDLRGVALPVVDLRLALGMPGAGASEPNVIIMLHEGRLLGLLSGPVTGVFNAPAQALKAARVTAGGSAVLAGSLRRDDLGQLVSVLSPQALACLPGVPWIEDPEPARQHQSAGEAGVAVDSAQRQMMLLRCGTVPLALDAISVHATLSNPVLRPSPLAQGWCKGLITHGGQDVPMVDLMACCGLGERAGGGPMQGFVLRTPQGLVGLLVDQVIDVMTVDAHAVVPLPPHVLPRGALFAGTLPLSPPAVLPQAQGQYLVLDGAALAAEPMLCGLAQVCAAEEHVQSRQDASRAHERAMVIYDVLGEWATPLEQITEILPFDGSRIVFNDLGPLLGVVAHRGRTVPIYCLRRLLGADSVDCTPTTTMLMVEADGEAAAFVVLKLLDIAPADWEPTLPGHGGTGDTSRPLVQVGQGAHQRMLPMLDLVARVRERRHLHPGLTPT